MNSYVPLGNNNNMMNMNAVAIPQIPQFNPYQDKFDRYNNLTQQQPQQQVANNTNMNFIVVENLQRAKEQIVPYGCTIWMRDSSEPYFYIKSVDSVGSPTFKVLKIEDITDNLPNQNNAQSDNFKFVEIQDFNSLSAQVEELKNTVNYYSNILNQTFINNNGEQPKEIKKVGRPKTIEKVGVTDV